MQARSPQVRMPIAGRHEEMLGGIEIGAARGLEVGPLDKPLVAKEDGPVFYVDHCSTEELKARWSSDRTVDVARLHVDAVWGRASLRDALDQAGVLRGRDDHMDYLLASHVVEHVPDLVTWLREVASVLGSVGTARLAVPDKRYTFDYLRRPTELAEVLDAFARQRRAPSGSRVLDFALHAVQVDCGAAWRGEIDASALQRMYTTQSAIELARDAELNGAYHDVHCWVFTPASWASLMLELAELGLLELRCEWMTGTAQYTFEFFVGLVSDPDRERCIGSWQAAVRLLDSLPAARPA